MTVSFVSLCARSSRPVLGRLFNASLHSDHSQGNSLHSYRLASWLKHRSKRQQLNVTPRVDTINVKYVGPPGTPSELIMTKNISTPNDCAKHLSGHFVDRSAVALVNGVCWDLHKPLDEDCELTFLNFKDIHNDPAIANVAFWHSSSLLLSLILERSFHPRHNVHVLQIYSFPASTLYASGSFSCDISFTQAKGAKSADLSSWWIPSAEEMRALSRQAQRVAALQIPFEPLLISQDLGSLIWNPAPEANYCSSFQRQLSLLRWELSALEKPKNDYVYEKYHAQLSGRPQDHICLYRLDDHIQLHPGPVISSAGLIGRFSVTSFRPLGLLNLASLDPIEVADSGDGLVHSVYRVTGVAIPTAFTIHFTTFEVLRSRAKQHNASIPDAPTYLLPLT